MGSFFHRKRLLLLPVALVIGGLALLCVSPVGAAVDLVRFEADAEDDRVRLEWETATEVDHAGFFVRRSLQEDVEQTKENDRIEVIDVDSEETINFISPRGDNLTGAVYTFLDANVAENVTYYYFLESIDAGDSSEFHGPRSAVIAGETTSTPTPTASETETPTVTDTAPTARGTATTTMTPSATPTRTPTTRLIPTLTRTPTVGAYPAPATPEPTGSVTPTPSPSAGTAPAYPAPAYPVPGGTETPFSVGTATVEGTLTVTGEVTVTPSPTLSPTPSPTPREPGSFFEGADEAILLRLRIAIGTLVVVGLVFSGAVYYYYALPTEKPGEQTDSSHEN